MRLCASRRAAFFFLHSFSLWPLLPQKLQTWVDGRLRAPVRDPARCVGRVLARAPARGRLLLPSGSMAVPILSRAFAVSSHEVSISMIDGLVVSAVACRMYLFVTWV